MCGIAFTLSGVRIVGCDICREPLGDAPSSPPPDADDSTLVMDDLQAALQRRGPDNLGSKKVLLQLDLADSAQVDGNVTHKQKDLHALFMETVEDDSVSLVEYPVFSSRAVAELNFLGATLQLRGVSPVFQPQVDSSGNLLIYNGEIFEGIYIDSNDNDTEALLHVLESCSSCVNCGFEKDCFCNKAALRSIPEILSTIRGPWALIYWHKKTKTLWFGRDPFGRRSLLVHWPTSVDSRFVLSSVSPASIDLDSGFKSRANDIEPRSDNKVAHISSKSGYWEELPCGIYSIELKASIPLEQVVKEKIVGEVRKHKWTGPLVHTLINWERTLVDPKVDSQPNFEKVQSLSTIDLGKDQDITDLPSFGTKIAYTSDIDGAIMGNHRHGNNLVAEKILTVLRQSVMQRTILKRNSQALLHRDEKEDAPIAVLFSGGLDSMILAALLDQCVDSQYAIDLLNVSFDGQLAPDRISARAGVAELQMIAPRRRWRLVEIDASLSSLEYEAKHVVSLIYPSKTYMDLNIGIALWLAAGGDGWVEGKDHIRYRYKSTARVLLVGSGADEQCGGYGRHRTKFRLGGLRLIRR